MNVKPYCYPYIQKSKIEKLEKEILDASIIRESTSSFSSLVLLVKKKLALGDLYGIPNIKSTHHI